VVPGPPGGRPRGDFTVGLSGVTAAPRTSQDTALSPVSGWDDDEVTAWLEARDDLAAVQSLLRNEASDGKSTLVREVLVLDRTAQGVLGARVRGLSSPKLRAVAWQYQNAWWGKVYG